MMNDHCNLLAERPDGFVSHCDCCQTFQIVFGNLALVKSEPELLEMIDTLTEISQCYCRKQPTNTKSIWLDTSLNAVRFVFTYSEIEAMLDLVEQAYLIFKAEQLINE